MTKTAMIRSAWLRWLLRRWYVRSGTFGASLTLGPALCDRMPEALIYLTN